MAADDTEAEQLTRTRLQSGGLLQADMAAFKAANPTCQLADFLRWHSPKDWQPDPTHPQGGSLSDRMAHQVWSAHILSMLSFTVVARAESAEKSC